MEWESTISSGRNAEITPPAAPGSGEFGALMVATIWSSEPSACAGGPAVRTRYALGPGTLLPCVLRTDAGISCSSTMAPMPMPGPTRAGIVAVPTMVSRDGRPPPNATSTVFPRCLPSRSIVAAPRTIWFACCRP